MNKGGGILFDDSGSGRTTTARCLIVVLGRFGGGNDVEEIIAGRMAFHFVMVLVGLLGSVNRSQTRARLLLPTHLSGSFPLAEYFLRDIFLQATHYYVWIFDFSFFFSLSSSRMD